LIQPLIQPLIQALIQPNSFSIQRRALTDLASPSCLVVRPSIGEPPAQVWQEFQQTLYGKSASKQCESFSLQSGQRRSGTNGSVGGRNHQQWRR
jgi:hypothetical protein